MVGRVVWCQLESLGNCINGFVIAFPFVVGGLIQHRLWQQCPPSGSGVKLLEALGEGVVGRSKMFGVCLLPGVLARQSKHVGVVCLFSETHNDRVKAC